MDELTNIMHKFAESGWELISIPAKNWLDCLDGDVDKGKIVNAIKQADLECGSCGCEFDPLYKRVLELL